MKLEAHLIPAEEVQVGDWMLTPYNTMAPETVASIDQRPILNRDDFSITLLNGFAMRAERGQNLLIFRPAKETA